jgi:Tol biopolymer transport system component
LVIGAVIGAGAWALLGIRGATGASSFSEVAHFSIQIPDDQLAPVYWALSPDGRSLVYTSSPRNADDPDEATSTAYLRRFDSTEPVKIDGTAGITNFVFSPDGRWIMARVPVSPKAAKYRLVKLRVDSSAPPVTLLELPDTWSGPVAWLPDGDIVMGQLEPLAVIRIPSDGGRPSEPIEIVNEGFEGIIGFDNSHACILPDGKHALGSITSYGDSWDIHVGLLDLETGQARLVVDNGGNPKWSSTGHVLFTRGETLMAVPFDPERLETTGTQVAVTDGLFAPTVYNAGFDVSHHGTLIHFPGGLVGVDRRLMFIDRDTQQITEPWSDDRRPFEGRVTVSPDGERLAVTLINADRYYEIWTSEMDQPRLTRFAAEPGLDCTPGAWHPDGERVTYLCASTDRGMLYLRSVESNDAPRILGQWSAANEWISAYHRSFTPDGAHVILTHRVQGESKLVRLSLNEQDATPVLLLEDASWGTVSPDGQYIMYSSDASGRTETYLRSIDADLRLGREVPVTRDGADFAWWDSPTGEPLTIAYSSSGRLYELKVTPGDRVRLSDPRLIGDMSEVNSKLSGFWWDLLDGRLLAIVEGEGEETPQELTVVVNWRRELEERLRAER